MVVSSLVVFGEMVLLIGFLRIIKAATRLVPGSYNVFDQNLWYNQSQELSKQQSLIKKDRNYYFLHRKREKSDVK